MACEVGDVALVEVLLGFQPDLGIREVVSSTVLACPYQYSAY